MGAWYNKKVGILKLAKNDKSIKRKNRIVQSLQGNPLQSDIAV